MNKGNNNLLTAKDNDFESNTTHSQEKSCWHKVFDFLVPNFTFKSFSFIIISIITLYFIIESCFFIFVLSSGWNCMLFKLGARHTPSIINHYHIHRLILPIFMHADILHILLNLVSLFLTSFYVENLLKTGKFVLLFLTTGIFGNILSTIFYRDLISVGASGSIFGLYGFMAYYFYRFSKEMDWQTKILYFLSLAYIFWGYFQTLFSQNSIDLAAHTGGLLSGWIITYYIYDVENSW